jgi:hypothetical protein
MSTEQQGFFAIEAIKRYQQEFYPRVILLDQEYAQLSWLQQTIHFRVTPEARGADLVDKIDFEIKRALARLNSIELLLQGDSDAYQEFIKAQAKPITFAVFKELAAELKSLDNATKQALRLSCLLTKTNIADEKIKAKRIDPEIDSEQFLTQIVNMPELLKLLPVIENVSAEVEEILKKIYLANTHFRHMMFTEGGNAMTTNISQLSPEGFKAWKWRWYINLMGFQAGPGAKYFDQDVHQLATIVIQCLTKDPRSYLDNYLHERAIYAGFNKPAFDQKEQALLAHLAAYCNQITILDPALGKDIEEGYRRFKEAVRTTELAELYHAHRTNPQTVSPTYVPAVLNSVFKILNNLSDATLFTCQVLDTLYRLPRNKLISCRDLAFEPKLKPLLEEWLRNNKQINFALDSGKGELVPKLLERATLTKLP